ncbi:MAG: hypothetical protein Q4D66_02825 [Bacteroidales bacterium]|nr:hypothetical protein [Bacteroidales bacterium]
MEHSTPQPRPSTLEYLKKLARDLQPASQATNGKLAFISTSQIYALCSC